MDFYTLKETPTKKGITVGPNFLVGQSKDFMVRGRSFYAIWNGETWSTNEFDVQRLVDSYIDMYIQERSDVNDEKYIPLYLRNFKTNSWKEFRTFLSHMPDTNKQLDAKLVFASDKPKRTDYSSKRLPYDMKKGPCDSYDELMSTLFAPEEKEKLEWAVGSILKGDSKFIQKFIVMYGEGGTGKSTFLNIVQMLFEGYYIAFDAKALVNGSDNFSTEMFKSNPLVAIQHDGDLSKIADNTKLNAIVAHEDLVVKEKFKPSYTIRANAFVFMGTNTPVMITDSHSGLIRRLIDVYPTGDKVSPRKYSKLMSNIEFELGAIAAKCLAVYTKLGRDYYNDYRPLGMMYRTDVFYNFVEDNYFLFLEQDSCTLKQAYDLYKEYCADSALKYVMPKYKFKDELKAYFVTFEERGRTDDGRQIRNLYKTFRKERFVSAIYEGDGDDVEEASSLIVTFDSTSSVIDKMYVDQPAQYATGKGTPKKKWDNVSTTLSDIDTSKLHYVKLPENHIVIDFDIKGDNGQKSLQKNLEAVSRWPSTYAEFSKSGNGIHLHYIFDGDPTRLSRVYSDGIEVKVFVGNASLRRKVSKCNSLAVAHISSGLPEGEKKMINAVAIKSERSLRALIKRNLNKEIHPGTKPSVDFIHKILEDANESGLVYDLSDMRGKILAFGAQSSNQSEYCIRLISQMKFKSEVVSESNVVENDGEIVFYDVEVFPNLFLIVWKKRGKGNKPVAMINPTSQEVEALFQMNLVGFYNRGYDNHILYGAYLGYNNEQLFELSSRLVDDKFKGGTFGEAYNISYSDVYEFGVKKQSLKKWEIELGLRHNELNHPWNEPLPKDRWPEAVEYCTDDVFATEAVFESIEDDWTARLMLAELSGLTPNHTTQRHAAKIIFGDDPNPQARFVYTDLSEMFPGYVFDPTKIPKSSYRGEEPSEGGYVFANFGVWDNVAEMDVASMHPESLIQLNAFGPYTDRFRELRDVRLAIKDGDLEKAKTMFDGRFKKYLKSNKKTKGLANALKLVINRVYGLTFATFENKFKDPRNRDNIVAKRGALFMIDLKHAAQERGYEVVHIKTDSIKIANVTKEAIRFVHNFGKKYGYTFKHEATYEKFALVNKAVYVAKYGWSEDSRDVGKWTATGAQFAHPYIFKTLFSKEPITFKDVCETRSVRAGVMYLDYNEKLPEGEHNYVHVGRVGQFVPVVSGAGGAELFRMNDGKYYAVTGTKGHRWKEAEVFKSVEKISDESTIDVSYFENLVEQAIKDISKYGDFDSFVK